MRKILKKAMSTILVMALACSMVACGADSDETENSTKTNVEDSTKDAESGNTTNEVDAFSSGAVSATSTKAVSTKLSMEDGAMSIQRAQRETETPMGEEGTWTILCYLCGTDLESQGNSGTDDIDEMLAASSSNKVNFVIQAGGTTEWSNDAIADSKLTRMLIQDGELKVLGTADATSMGDSGTLLSFLQWGIEKFPADNMGLIFWDHGSGSVNGVCFDELFDSDSLSLTEIDQALSAVYDQMTERFEFIGFDACLMSTLEVANMLVPHAKYMIASEETESGIGWEYTSILDFLAENPTADGAQLGKVICDSFFAGNEVYDLDSMSTLAVVDLSKVDEIMNAFNLAAEDIYKTLDDQQTFVQFCRCAMKAENYGGNNDNEGYTDMADLGDIMAKSSSVIGNTDQVIAAIKDAVVYQVRGSSRANGYGLAIFFPYAFSSEYINILKDISVSPYYMAFCDKFSYMSANGSTESNYDDSTWLSNDGYWGDQTEESEVWNEDDYDYWDCESQVYDIDEETQLGYLEFDMLPCLDEEGTYGFAVTPESLDYIESVRCNISQWIDDDEVMIGTDNDVDGDWESGYFADCFDGVWFSLPDGQNLCTYLIEEGDDYDIYCSPVELNGEEVYLRIVWDYVKNEVIIAGTWDGIDSDTGVSPRMQKGLSVGDVIVPLYEAYDSEGESITYSGSEYEFEGDSNIYYDTLDEGEYGYSFEIIDIYGNSYYSDYVTFTVDEDGNVYYE